MAGRRGLKERRNVEQRIIIGHVLGRTHQIHFANHFRYLIFVTFFKLLFSGMQKLFTCSQFDAFLSKHKVKFRIEFKIAIGIHQKVMRTRLGCQVKRRTLLACVFGNRENSLKIVPPFRPSRVVRSVCMTYNNMELHTNCVMPFT